MHQHSHSGGRLAIWQNLHLEAEKVLAQLGTDLQRFAHGARIQQPLPTPPASLILLYLPTRHLVELASSILAWGPTYGVWQ